MPAAHHRLARSAGAQGGQGTVEYVGVTVLVALLLAGLAVWVAGAVRSDRAPIDPVARLRAPLGGPASPGRPVDPVPRNTVPIGPGAPGPATPSVTRAPEGGGGGPGRWARRAVGVARQGASLAPIAARGFAEGARDRLRERVGEVVRDPGSLLPAPGSIEVDPEASVRRAREGVARARRYVGEVRHLSAREAVDRLSRDTGGVALDGLTEVAVGRGARLLARALGNAGRTSAPRPRAGQTGPSGSDDSPGRRR